MTWSDDPAVSIDVNYRTDAGVAQTLCEWIEAADLVGDHQTGGAKEPTSRTQGVSEPLVTNLGPCRRHTVKLRGLTPKTKYAYRVGDGVNWSSWNHFTTASAADDPFEFVYFGDAQNAVRSLWARVRREAHADAPKAAFALHAGDLVNSAESDGEWGEWHESAGWLNATVPTVAAPGNHEYARGLTGRKLSKLWRPGFSFPMNGPEGLEETCYWMIYQGALIVSLNTNEQLETQAEWLEDVLSEAANVNWKIVTFHHPVYSAAKERDNPEVRRLFKPLFDKHGVDLALQGHDHAYARSGPGGPESKIGTVNVGEGLNTRAGHTVYVVSVSGPKMYPLNETWDVRRVAKDTQLYQKLRVSPESIVYEAFTASGELYDSFTLRKRAGEPPEMIEHTDD